MSIVLLIRVVKLVLKLLLYHSQKYQYLAKSNILKTIKQNSNYKFLTFKARIVFI